MKKIAFALLTGIVLFSASCQKEIADTIGSSVDSTGTPITGSSSLVKTYTEKQITGSDSTSITFNLSYDASNRITSIVSAANAGDRFVYRYNTNKTYTMDLYNQNVLSIASTFFLNSFNLPDSMVQINDTQDTSTTKILYDTNKRPVQQREYDRAGGASVLLETSFYEYDNNGNIIAETSGSERTTYTYSSLLNNLNMGDIYGYKNKNLAQTTVTNRTGANITLSHTYTFDSQNRLTSEKITGSTGEVLTKTYTY
jgi:hypothetical protein